VGGEAVPGALARIKTVLDECKPDYITVSYGLNDMGLKEVKAEPQYFEQQLRALIKAIQTHPAKPQILLLTSTPFRDDIHFFKDDPAIKAKGGPNAMLHREINAATRRIAKELNLPLFDMYRLFMDNGHEKLISKDGVHPSTEGGRLLADKLQQWLAQYVRVREFKDESALANVQKAKALVTEAEGLKVKDAPGAQVKLCEAAEMCPYLAEIYVTMDEIEFKKE